MTPEFFVIFTPRTFDHLKYFSLSFLLHSDIRLALVSNALPDPEADRMASFCERHERLRLVDYPTQRVLPHGTILQRLAENHSDEWFAFMDSDVFATGDISQWLSEELQTADIFSSTRVAKSPARPRVGFGGQATVSPAGYPVAVSYFCCYRFSTFVEVQREFGVTLERYSRPTQIPGRAFAALAPGDSGAEAYDTGKLASLLAASAGKRVKHVLHDHLLHLGSMSKDFEGGDHSRPMRRNHAAVQAYFQHVLTRPESEQDPPLELDAAWKETAVRKTARNIRSLMRQLAQTFPEEFADSR